MKDSWVIVWCGTSDRYAPPDKARPPRPLLGVDTHPMKFESEDDAKRYLVELVIIDSHEPGFTDELRVMKRSAAEALGSDVS